MKFKFEAIHSPDYSALDTTIYFGDAGLPYLLESAEGLGSPEFTPQTQKAPFQQGETYIDGQHSPRIITLNLRSTSEDFTTTETYKRTISRALNPVGMGYDNNTGETYLGKLSYAPDGVNYTYFIDCVPIGSPVTPFKVFQDKYQPFQVSFFCPDPYWYGAEVELEGTVLGLSSDDYEDVCFSEDLKMFVAVGSGTKKILYSKNGILWTDITPVAMSATTTLRGITWSSYASLFLAVGDDSASGGTSSAWKSVDGLTWETVPNTNVHGASGIVWNSVCYAESISGVGTVANSFYLCGSLGEIGITNGTTGSKIVTLVGFGLVFKDIAFARELGIIVAVSSYGANPVASSTDGTTWTQGTCSTASWQGIDWSPDLGLFMAVGGGATNYSMSSPNGTTWTNRATAENNTWISVVWSQRLLSFVAVSSNGTNRCQVSTNGTSWTAKAMSGTPANTAICDSVYLGRLLAVASSATYPQLSYNATTWTAPTTNDVYVNASITSDCPIGFELDIPTSTGTNAKLSIGNRLIWDGVYTITDEALIGLSLGSTSTAGVINLVTTSMNPSISKFGTSIISKVTGGSYFYLDLNSVSTNVIIIRPTGMTIPGTVKLRYNPRYSGV